MPSNPFEPELTEGEVTTGGGAGSEPAVAEGSTPSSPISPSASSGLTEGGQAMVSEEISEQIDPVVRSGSTSSKQPPPSVSSDPGEAGVGSTAGSSPGAAADTPRVPLPGVTAAEAAKRMKELVESRPEIIKVPADVPPALKRVTNIDHEWLMRRAQKKPKR